MIGRCLLFPDPKLLLLLLLASGAAGAAPARTGRQATPASQTGSGKQSGSANPTGSAEQRGRASQTGTGRRQDQQRQDHQRQDQPVVQRVRKLYQAEQWSAVVQAVPLPGPGEARPAGEAGPAAELLLLRGLALARMDRLAEAAATLRLAGGLYPRDARFPTELAGIRYRQHRNAAAARLLRRAIRQMRPQDPNLAYARNLLGTVDDLEGNLEAAIADWNPVGRPVLADQRLDNQQLDTSGHSAALPPLLMDRVFPFAMNGVYRLQQYRRTQAELALQQLFVSTSLELHPLPDGRFDLAVHPVPHPAWRSRPVASLLSTLRSLPYQAVNPEFWNLGHTATSLTTYLRWDAQKRMILASLAGPVHTPDQRLGVWLDARNENWDLARTLTPGRPVAAGLNQERLAGGVSLDELFGWRLLWQTTAEVSRRRFRSGYGLPTGSSYFTGTTAMTVRSAVQAKLVDAPGARLQLTAMLQAAASRYFQAPLTQSARLQAGLDAVWLPQATGDRYRLHAQARGGDTLGAIPFDELWMLGFDRDNPLWMRGHNGLVQGRKGNAPLGTRYLLGNLDLERLLWRDPFVSVRVGPFVDTGRIYGSAESGGTGVGGTGSGGTGSGAAGLFGSPIWMTDAGVQARLHLFQGSRLILGWGHDLRSGGNTFYSAISH